MKSIWELRLQKIGDISVRRNKLIPDVLKGDGVAMEKFWSLRTLAFDVAFGIRDEDLLSDAKMNITGERECA